MRSGDPKILLSDEDWENAVRREQVIRPLSQKKTLSPDDIIEACEKLGIKRAMLYRLLKEYSKNPRTSSLVPRKRGRSKGYISLPPEAEKIIEDAINEYYLTSQKPFISKLVRIVAVEARKADMICPSRKAIQSRIDALDTKMVMKKREGAKFADDKLRPVKGQLLATKPLEIVQVDHTKVDIIVVDEKHRLAIGRPWLTLLIDIATRMVTGYYLSLQAPSSTSVALALQHSVLKKEKWLNQRDIDIPWPTKGLPEKLHMDNGKDFHALALKRGAQEYGITLSYRPIARPHYGGHIERLIGTMMGEVHLLPGTTFSNIDERGAYDSEGRASMTLKELDRWLAIQIAGQYHHQIHTSLGRPPIAVWNELTITSEETLRQPSDEQRFFYDFLPVVQRKVRRDGIELNGFRYWDNFLSLWAGRTNHPFIVRYDPRDLSLIFLQAPDGEYWPVRYANLGRPAVTLWEANDARRKLREQGRREINEAMIFASIEAQRELVDEASKKTKTARRQRQKTVEALSATYPNNNDQQESKELTEAAPEDHAYEPYDVEEW